MFVRVPLDRICDNPFQTRSDYGDVAELADSLLNMQAARPETSGLLHVPPGRIVLDGQVLDPAAYGGLLACLGDEPQAVVELAAGHRRLRAFRQLAADQQEYTTFPVAVSPLGDQAMADVAWEENAKRKDLSPIEEAEALQRAMTRFSWTQAEVGRRWGLSQSAVANKLRLLGLPHDAQAAIRAGQLSERHGRALLAAAGKSQRIYQAVAAQIIPRPMASAEAAGRARQLVKTANFHTTHWFKQQTVVCAACQVSLSVGDGLEVYSALVDDAASDNGYQYIYLCQTCYRTATNWTPPSAAESDKLVEQVTYRQIVGLHNPHFPLDVEMAASGIVSARCTDCTARQERAGRDECLDRQCYDAKRALWEARQADELCVRLRELYPDVDDFKVDDFRGYDLRASDQADRAMVRDGHCGPHCERLGFHRIYSDYYLQPFDDLPFAYACNNSNAHLACQRRYLAAQQTDADKAAEEQLKNSVASNRQAANVLLQRARLSVARALLDGHAGAWLQLAQCFGSGEPKSLDDALARAAGKVIAWDLDCHHDWSEQDTPTKFQAEIQRIMTRLGIALLPGPDDVARRLERIAGFVLDEHGQPRGDLSPEQVRGNRTNLRRLRAELAQMAADGRATEEGAAHLSERIAHLRRALDISREMSR